MFRKIDPEKITIACKTCGEIFHSVEAFQMHQRNIWTRLSHMFLFGCVNELQTHKSIYQAGHEVSCIVCEGHYDECTPNKDNLSTTYLIDGR